MWQGFKPRYGWIHCLFWHSIPSTVWCLHINMTLICMWGDIQSLNLEKIWYNMPQNQLFALFSISLTNNSLEVLLSGICSVCWPDELTDDCFDTWHITHDMIPSAIYHGLTISLTRCVTWASYLIHLFKSQFSHLYNGSKFNRSWVWSDLCSGWHI